MSILLIVSVQAPEVSRKACVDAAWTASWMPCDSGHGSFSGDAN